MMPGAHIVPWEFSGESKPSVQVVRGEPNEQKVSPIWESIK